MLAFLEYRTNEISINFIYLIRYKTIPSQTEVNSLPVGLDTRSKDAFLVVPLTIPTHNQFLNRQFFGLESL